MLRQLRVEFENIAVSSLALIPNPDIEKIDIGSHMDLEKFFLN
jgi:hypothetical protein